MSSQKRQNSDDVGDDTSLASAAQADDELTDRATVEKLIARQERGTRTESTPTPDARQYECLDCGARVDAFPVECPDCASSDFETVVTHEGTNFETPAEALFDAYAELTAPYNPYVPR